MANRGMEATEKTLNILCRFAFLLYWFFDNIAVLVKVKFFSFMELKTASTWASRFWLIGIVFGVIIGSMGIAKQSKAAKALYKAKKEQSIDEKEFNTEKAAIKAAKNKAILDIIKNLGDGCTASQALGYPKMIIGTDFNDAVVGIGGFTSAFINVRAQYAATAPK